MDNLMRINASVVSHTGTLSNVQQDNFYINGRYKNEYETDNIQVSVENSGMEYLFAVCDGMDRTEPEKRAAVSMARELEKLQESFRNNEGRIDGKLDRIKDQIQEINNLIYTLSINSPDVADAPASFSGILLSGGRAAALNIGKGKAFFVRAGSIQTFFTDVKKTEKLLKLGVLTDEQARMLSGQQGAAADSGKARIQKSKALELQAGDILVMCTDGLADYVDEDRMREILSLRKDTSFIANTLVLEAIKNGSRDNITVMVVRVDSASKVSKPGPVYTRDFSKKLDQQDYRRKKKENVRTAAAVVVSSLAIIGVLAAAYVLMLGKSGGDSTLVPVTTQTAEITDIDKPADGSGESDDANTSGSEDAGNVPDEQQNPENTEDTDNPGRTPASGTEYTVKAGDTLQSISLKQYGTINKYKLIMEANKITDPDSISQGQVLILP